MPRCAPIDGRRDATGRPCVAPPHRARGLVLLASSWLAIAGPAGAAPPAGPEAPQAQHAAAVGRDALRASRLDAYFAPLARSSDLSGTLRVQGDDGSVLVRHYGFADWTARAPHTGATRYGAASVTKGVLAATLVTLARDRTLSLDDPVTRWLPQVPLARTVSLRDVLQHRAGLPRDFPDGAAHGSGAAQWLAQHPAAVEPAGSRRYSNVGYALLAEVIEAASGTSFAEAARRVLDPAGMHDSAIVPGSAAHAPHGAHPYTAGPGPDGVMTPVPAPPEAGASGLVTTAADLAAWARTLADGAYPELFAGDEALGSIDTGRDANGDYVSVQGTLPGYVANAVAWRDRRLTVSFTGNLFSYPALDLDTTLRALLGPRPPAPPAARPAEVPLDDAHLAWLGEHTLEGVGRVRVARDASTGHLTLTLPGKPAHWSFHLTPNAGGALHWRAFGRILRSDGSGGRAD